MSVATATSKSWSGPALKFNILKECSQSRCRTSVLELPHHTLETPTFMPVGTKGTMKGLIPEQVEAAGADIILGNTYHLGTKPGQEVLSLSGGLHKWMNWNRGLLTDSGGFQMVSLLRFAKITEEGVTFRSPYDDSECVLTPEESMSIQNAIGADIMMQLDDVVDVKETQYERFKEATHRTTRWLDRCIAANKNPETQNLFPIVQGGLFPDLRDLSLQQLLERDSPGYAVGGLSGGEDKSQFWTVIHQCTGQLPINKPRYCMGVGMAPDLVVCVALGVDMFDCVYPTRTARFGCALIETGQFSLKSLKYRDDFEAIDNNCDCSTCLNYSRAYLYAAWTSKATVACHLISVHNIAYQMRLMNNIRESVKGDSFPEFVNDFMQKFYKNSAVPQWIVDALAAVNIKLTKSESVVTSERQQMSFDERVPNLMDSDQPPGLQLEDYIKTLNTEDSAKSMEDFTNQSETNSDNSNLDETKTKKFQPNISRNSVQNSCVFFSEDDSDDEKLCNHEPSSGFEIRCYNQGYRETLRQDYPDEVEVARKTGFTDALQFIISSKNNFLNESSGDGRQVIENAAAAAGICSENNEYSESSVISSQSQNLAALDGSLSLLLLKHQEILEEKDLREVVSIKEAIKKDLEELNVGFDNHFLRSFRLKFFSVCNEENSVSTTGVVNENKCCSLDEKSENQCCSGGKCSSADRQDLFDRAKKLCCKVNWDIPLI